MTVEELYNYMKAKHPSLNHTAFLVMLNDVLRDISKETFIYSYSMTTSTVVGQREYELPLNVLQVYRVDYDGKEITEISEGQVTYTDIS